jgi:hypothetical protein
MGKKRGKEKRLCVKCGKRPPRHITRGKRYCGPHLSQGHELCAQCWRALRNSMREGRPYGRGRRRIEFPEQLD